MDTVSALALIFASLVWMAFVWRRLLSRLFPPTSGERTPVPWEWTDALLIGIVFFFLPGALMSLYDLIPPKSRPASLRFEKNDFSPATLRFLEEEDARAAIAPDETAVEIADESADAPKSTEWEKLAKEHGLTRLLILSRSSGRFGFVALFCFLAGVVAAPIVEEFMFRLVFQGSVEKAFPGQARAKRLAAILIPAVLFAAIHYRAVEPLGWNALDRLLTGIVFTPPTLALILAFGLLWLCRVGGASARDLGWDAKQWRGDIARGFGLFALFAPQMFLLQAGLGALFPDRVTDPVPIFFLAIYLGVITSRTRRITPAVGMHAALNLFSFVMIAARIYLVR